MEKDAIRRLLEQVRRGDVAVREAMEALHELPFSDLGYAKVDHHRAVRKGSPEVIFCQGKSVDDVLGIISRQRTRGETVFGTRASEKILAAVTERFPDTESNRVARCFWRKSRGWKKKPKTRRRGTVVVASGGTSDAPVAEEARVTVELLGHECTALHDVGVAGIHRLFAFKKELREAGVVIAVAGMEGALPSVIAGYVSCPVIGVPTSVGYGSHLGGMVPLFAMLNSCASGLCVVNIDNGFGAGYAATLMNAR